MPRTDYRRKVDREYWAKNRERFKEYRRQRAYGISPAQFQRLMDEQQDGCAICGRVRADGEKALHVDHNHDTGEVRGLLCDECNQGLGKFGDDPARLREAARYLEGKGTIP